MPFLIDGHNLIAKLPDLSLDDPNDEAKLVHKLRGFGARTGKSCCVIFDHGLPGGQSKLSNDVVKVIFAAHPGKADDLMIARIRKTPDSTRWTVVTSDERVLAAARQRGMKTMYALEFARMLRQPAPPPREEHPHVYVSPQEVEEWLRLFNAEE